MKNKKIFIILITIFTFLFTKSVLALEETSNFTELQFLIDNTTGTLTLEKDYVNNGSEAQLEIKKDLVLDLNGHVINANSHGRVFYIHGDIDVTIIDSNKDAIHKFDVDSNNLLATLNETSGTLEVKGGCITGGSSDANGGSGIYLEGSSLTFKAGNIIGNTCVKWGYGTGIKLVSNANVVVDGGNILHNSTAGEGNGGGIEINSGNLTLKSGTIGYNNSTYNGGISLDDANGKVIMEGGVVVGNQSTHIGAGVGCTAGVIEIKGGVIKENVTVTPYLGHGGGVGTDLNGTVIITGGKIINNKAMRGGGIGVWRGGNIYIYGGEITGNLSIADTTPYDGGNSINAGGGIYFDSSYIYYSGITPVNLTIGKDAIIKDNYNDVTKKEENVYFTNGLKINIGTGEYAPSDKMDVGITMANVGVFTNNTSEDYGYGFSYDEKGYSAVKDNNTLKFVTDTENPTGKISFKGNFFTSFLNTITFGLFFNEKYDVEITADDDTTIKSIEYYISNNEMTLDEVKAITSWKKYSKISIEEEDKYVIYAKITDRANNVVYISSDGFILDMTTPVINGLDAEKIYYTTQKFTITEVNLKQVLINDVEVNNYKLDGNINKTYQIKVIDKAGNTVDNFEITMKTISSISDSIKDMTIENVKISDKEVIENIKDNIENIDITYATSEEKKEVQEIIDKCNLLLEAIKSKNISEIEITLTSPKTGDDVISYLIIISISLISLTGCVLYLNHKRK